MNDNYIKRDRAPDRTTPGRYNSESNKLCDCTYETNLRLKYCNMEMVDPECGRSIVRAATAKTLTKGERFRARKGGGEAY